MLPYPKLVGLVAAPFTAFQADGSLNLELIEQQAAALQANEVTGAFICGTTGEGASLSTSERIAVAERWQAVADKKLRIIVNVSHTSLPECRLLATHAQKIGSFGIGCMAPYFFKPSNVEDLVSFCAEVGAAAPGLPFYYYQIPSMTGVGIPAAGFLRLAARHIPTLAGVKFTFENLMDYAECVQFAGGRYDMVFGRDEILLAALSLGARGTIGSTYNFAAPIYRRIIEAFERGDLATARAEQSRANAMIAVITRFGGLPAGKAIMKMIGLDLGQARLPLAILSETRRSELRDELEKVGFFDFCSRI